MPKRKSIRRFASDKVQGEDSWVLVAMLTVEEMRESRKVVSAQGFDAFELGVDLLKKHCREWNWVWDDGSPMPQPKESPDVIEKLTDLEVDFLGNCIRGSEEEAKN